MSFSENVKNELATRREKLTCCRKAFVYGLLLNADAHEPIFETENSILRDEAVALFSEQFGREPEVLEKNRVGHKRYLIPLDPPSCKRTLACLDEKKNIEEAVGFRCEKCRESFIRAAFLSAAGVSDPLKSYHLEFRVRSEARASALAAELKMAGFEPRRTRRGEIVGLYFKGSEEIEDMLTYIGASKTLFECMNDKILRDIRADENRKANCETGNIAKSVGASLEVVEAIRYLRETGLFSALSPELSEAAVIREENPEASLSELARIFPSAISKSGLSHRLKKIKELADKARESDPDGKPNK